MKKEMLRAVCAECGCEMEAEIRHAWVEREHKGVKYHFVEKQPICRKCGQLVCAPDIDRFNAAESAYCYRRACHKIGTAVDPEQGELAWKKINWACRGNTKAYEDLANEVVLRAAAEYRTALQIRSTSKAAEDVVRGFELFIFSDWFAQLTEVNPHYLILKIRTEIEKEEN